MHLENKSVPLAFALASIFSSACSVQTMDVRLNKMLLTAVHLTLHVIMRSGLGVERGSCSAPQNVTVTVLWIA